MSADELNMVGISRTACSCASVIVSGLAWLQINGCSAAVHGSMTANGGTVLAASTATAGAPAGAMGIQAAAAREADKVTFEGQRYAYQPDLSQPHLEGGITFTEAPQTPCVFAKSCTVPKGTTQAGTSVEPASNFGEVALFASTGEGAGSSLAPVGSSAIGTSLSAWSWAIRAAGPIGAAAGASGAAAAGGLATPALATLVGVLIPNSVGDGRLYQDQAIDPAQLAEAATRVRFQFRRDPQGSVQLYGIHTTPFGGEDRVPTTKPGGATTKAQCRPTSMA